MITKSVIHGDAAGLEANLDLSWDNSPCPKLVVKVGVKFRLPSQ